MSYKIIGENQIIENRESTPSLPSSVERVSEPSDVAETIKELNVDTLDSNKFSSIDLKTRLHPIEISSIIAVDSLIALRFLPSNSSIITRSKKRLAVSLGGKGREEIVSISQGMKEQESGKSMMGRLSGFFGGGK